jgi:Flp pilus assembly protein TadD
MLDEAISEFKKAIGINPNYAKAHHNLGNIYADKEMMDEAISEYKKAIAININYADAYNNLAWLYATSSNVTLRNGEKAVSLATKACELTKLGYPLD